MRASLVAVLLAMPQVSLAEPYLRFIDPAHPQISAGALLDPNHIGQSQAVTNVALILHRSCDESIIPEKLRPYLGRESWVPLQIGGGGTGGAYSANVGASANLLPQVQALLRSGLNRITKPETLIGVKDMLLKSDGTVAFSAGPAFAWNLVEDGGALSPGKWKGRFAIFAGAAWKF